MSLFPPPFLLFSSSQPVFSLPFFSPCFETDCLLPSQRHLVLIDWQVTEEEEHSVTGGVGSADRPGEKHDVRNAVLQSMRDHFWLEGSVAKKNWLVAFQFCVKWCATQIEKHATCKQMHTRLHFRRGDVCTLGPWPSSVAQDKRSCPTKELYT